MDRRKKQTIFLADIIQIFSIMYFLLALLSAAFFLFEWIILLVPIGILGLLPITSFGLNPLNYSDGYPTGFSSAGIILLFSLVVLSVATFWAASEMKKLRLRGIITYTLVVLILAAGILIDSKTQPHDINPLYPLVSGLFVLIGIYLWILITAQRKSK